MLWEPWDILRKTILIVLAMLIYYAVAQVRHRFSQGELAGGDWLVAHPGLGLRRVVRR